MKISIGSDHAGYGLKESIKSYLESAGNLVKDSGAYSEDSVDYPDLVGAVVDAVKTGEADYGILICGTGIGMAIAANKYRGVRAALCGDTFSARCSRAHNDANILTMGSRVIGPGLAEDIVDAFLKGVYEGGRHSRRLDKIALLENDR